MRGVRGLFIVVLFILVLTLAVSACPYTANWTVNDTEFNCTNMTINIENIDFVNVTFRLVNTTITFDDDADIRNSTVIMRDVYWNSTNGTYIDESDIYINDSILYSEDWLDFSDSRCNISNTDIYFDLIFSLSSNCTFNGGGIYNHTTNAFADMSIVSDNVEFIDMEMIGTDLIMSPNNIVTFDNATLLWDGISFLSGNYSIIDSVFSANNVNMDDSNVSIISTTINSTNHIDITNITLNVSDSNIYGTNISMNGSGMKSFFYDSTILANRTLLIEDGNMTAYDTNISTITGSSPFGVGLYIDADRIYWENVTSIVLGGSNTLVDVDQNTNITINNSVLWWNKSSFGNDLLVLYNTTYYLLYSGFALADLSIIDSNLTGGTLSLESPAGGSSTVTFNRTDIEGLRFNGNKKATPGALTINAEDTTIDKYYVYFQSTNGGEASYLYNKTGDHTQIFSSAQADMINTTITTLKVTVDKGAVNISNSSISKINISYDSPWSIINLTLNSTNVSTLLLENVDAGEILLDNAMVTQNIIINQTGNLTVFIHGELNTSGATLSTLTSNTTNITREFYGTIKDDKDVAVANQECEIREDASTWIMNFTADGAGVFIFNHTMNESWFSGSPRIYCNNTLVKTLTQFGFETTPMLLIYDFNPAIVNTITPANNSVNISEYTNITIEFDEDIDPASDGDNFKLYKNDTNTSVTLNIAIDGNNITLEPDTILTSNATYRVELIDVADLYSNIMSNATYYFNTTPQDTDGDGTPDTIDTDDDNDGILDGNDTINGNESNIITNLSIEIIVNDSTTLNISFNDSYTLQINDTDRNITLVEFTNQFNETTIDFYNTIIREGELTNVGSILIYGIHPSGTKTVMFEQKNTSTEGICILDTNVLNLYSFTSYCTGASETYIDCDNVTDSGYKCEEINQSGEYYLRVSGLTNSAVQQQCQEDWSCTTWSTCASSSQSRTCTDNNVCGTEIDKPSETQSCSTGGGSTGGSSSGGSISGGGGTPTLLTDAPSIYNFKVIFEVDQYANFYFRAEQTSMTLTTKEMIPQGYIEYRSYKTTLNTDKTIAKSAEYDVRVDNIWLAQNTIDPDDIRVIIESEEGPKLITPEKTGGDAMFTFYRVKSELPQYITIIGESTQSVWSAPADPQIQSPAAPTGNAVDDTNQDTGSSELFDDETGGDKSSLLSGAIIMIVILVLIGGGVYVFTQYKKSGIQHKRGPVLEAKISPELIFEKINNMRQKLNAEATIVLTKQMDEIKKDLEYVEDKYKNILQEEVDEIQRYIDSRSGPVTTKMEYPYSTKETLYGMLNRAEKSVEAGDKILSHKYYMQAREFYPLLEPEEQEIVYGAMMNVFNKIR